MSRREGGRWRFSEGFGGEGDAVKSDEAEGESDADGVSGRDFSLAFERSTHGFSGGILGTVYCATAGKDISHRFGAQTPTRTRQAATRRLTLQSSGCMSAKVMDLNLALRQCKTHRS